MKQITGCFDYRDIRYRYRKWMANDAQECQADSRALSPIVLVHGFSQSSETWQEVAPLFTKARLVYALDLVGHGGSQVPGQAAPYLLARQADALLSFVQFARLDSAQGGEAATDQMRESVGDPTACAKAVVVGYSLGGRILVEAATSNPERFVREIDTVVLESAGLGMPSEQERIAAAQKDHACAQRLREGGLVRFMNWWERQPVFATQNDLDEETRSQLRADRLANDEEALARTFEYAGQHCMPSIDKTFDAAQYLIQAGVGVGYITGQRDKKYSMLAKLIRTNQALESFYTEIIPGVGHNVHLEDPYAFAGMVEAMLA